MYHVSQKCLNPTALLANRPKNIAAGKYTQSSSVAHSGVSSRATDGNDNTHWRGNSCMHTHHENNPWVMVDLGGAAMVNHVSQVIYKNIDDVVFCFLFVLNCNFVSISMDTYLSCMI